MNIIQPWLTPPSAPGLDVGDIVALCANTENYEALESALHRPLRIIKLRDNSPMKYLVEDRQGRSYFCAETFLYRHSELRRIRKTFDKRRIPK
jgi:hypothetical protein